GAVVHEHVHAELDAAADLVERAVEVVERHPDRLEPGRGRVVRPLPAMARHVDPVARLVPGADRLDRAWVGLAGGEFLVGARPGTQGTTTGRPPRPTGGRSTGAST